MPEQHKKIFALVVALALLITVVMAIGKDAIQVNRQADAAIFEQTVENIYRGKGAVSNVFSATQNFIDRLYFTFSMPELVEKDLQPPDQAERDMLHFHAYWLLYALAPLLSLMGSSLLLTMAQLFAYAGLACAAFYVVLREGRVAGVAVLFGIIVILSPVWLGGSFGQFYPDRLFVFLGFLLCAFVYHRVHLVWILIVAVVTALLNERAALIGGIILVLLPFCRQNEPLFYKSKFIIPAIGIVLLAYSYFIGKLWLSNLYFNTYLPADISELLARLANPVFRGRIIQLFLANAVLLVLAFGNYRLGLLALVVLLPNIIGDIGGAEKMGWLTHYHSYYFPVLVFAAAIGLVFWIGKLNSNKYLIRAGFGMALVGSLLAYKIQVESENLPKLTSVKSYVNSFAAKARGLPTGYSIRDQVMEAIPTGSLVVADELGMVMLKNHVRLDYFPVSAVSADYLLVPCGWVENSPKIDAFVRRLGFDGVPAKRFNAIGRCLYEHENTD